MDDKDIADLKAKLTKAQEDLLATKKMAEDARRDLDTLKEQVAKLMADDVGNQAMALAGQANEQADRANYALDNLKSDGTLTILRPGGKITMGQFHFPALFDIYKRTTTTIQIKGSPDDTPVEVAGIMVEVGLGTAELDTDITITENCYIFLKVDPSTGSATLEQDTAYPTDAPFIPLWYIAFSDTGGQIIPFTTFDLRTMAIKELPEPAVAYNVVTRDSTGKKWIADWVRAHG